MDLYTIQSPSGAPTLAEVAARLHVSQSAVDASYGVVLIDPVRHLYAVRIFEGLGSSSSHDPSVSGPFSDPKIEGFGPPRR
jgi:hypothetical protein